MPAQKGSDMLLKVGDGATPEVFTSAAGLRTKTFKLNSETVDVTNADSANKFRELLEGAGIKSASVSGSGVFKDATVDETVRAAAFAGTIQNYQVIVPGFGTIEGPFQISDLQYGGEHNKEVTWDLTLQSAGELAFDAA